MNTGYYRFQIGEFTYICVSDGTKDYNPKFFFNNVEETVFQGALRQKNLPNFLPFPSLGTVSKKGAGWQWKPVSA